LGLGWCASDVRHSHRVSRKFFEAMVSQADRLYLLCDEHFSVDGTLIEAAASSQKVR
jgi:hypothetical protein